ncbi:MAG: hypothetical protein ACT4PO_05850 [Actinomycetota bacterium]
MLDGTKHEAIGIYMALADRVAFERRYASSILDIAREAKAMGADGIPMTKIDLNEERAAFFSWRVLDRADAGAGAFEEFLEAVEEISIEKLEGPADPTVADPPPGT